MKIELHKKEGENYTIPEVILAIFLVLSTYGFIGYILWLLLIAMWK